jgi:hypothetical protein
LSTRARPSAPPGHRQRREIDTTLSAMMPAIYELDLEDTFETLTQRIAVASAACGPLRPHPDVGRPGRGCAPQCCAAAS